MNKYHQKLEKKTGLPYVTYNQYKPPVYQMVNKRWRKVEKGVPLTMADDCARKKMKMAKRVSRG